MVREWKDPHLGYGNSSVVRFFVGQERAVLERFYATPPEAIVRDYASKEQNFLTKAADEVAFWPEDWCLSFARSCLPRNRLLRLFCRPARPYAGKILVFYGSITPASALEGEIDNSKRSRRSFGPRPRRRFLPARWIKELWRE